jgi:hypothetical protein
MSMSTPARKLLRAGVASSSAIPCSMISLIDVQSLTTNPWKPHSPLRTWVSVNALALEGTPSRELKADMSVPAPSSTAGLNGGR